MIFIVLCMVVARYGMSHVLVLADFPPSTRTTDLEKVFEKFRDQGVVIRWVNDTVALAVFRNPSIGMLLSTSSLACCHPITNIVNILKVSFCSFGTIFLFY